MVLYYASCNISGQLLYFTCEPCQHWGNRTGKTHHSTVIFKYQIVFHLAIITQLPNKTNANSTLGKVLSHSFLDTDSWGASNWFCDCWGIPSLLWPLPAPSLTHVPGWTHRHAFLHLSSSSCIPTGPSSHSVPPEESYVLFISELLTPSQCSAYKVIPNIYSTAGTRDGEEIQTSPSGTSQKGNMG